MVSRDPDAHARQLANLGAVQRGEMTVDEVIARGKARDRLTPALRDVQDMTPEQFEAWQPRTMAERLAKAQWAKALDEVRNYGDHARDTVIDRIAGPLPRDTVKVEINQAYAELQQRIVNALQQPASTPAVGADNQVQIQERSESSDC